MTPRFKFGWDAILYLKGFLDDADDEGVRDALAHLESLHPIGSSPSQIGRSASSERIALAARALLRELGEAS